MLFDLQSYYRYTEFSTTVNNICCHFSQIIQLLKKAKSYVSLRTLRCFTVHTVSQLLSIVVIPQLTANKINRIEQVTVRAGKIISPWSYYKKLYLTIMGGLHSLITLIITLQKLHSNPFYLIIAISFGNEKVVQPKMCINII